MLYDEAGNIIGGTDAEGSLIANQVIFAPNPQNALLGEVSEVPGILDCRKRFEQ